MQRDSDGMIHINYTFNCPSLFKILDAFVDMFKVAVC